MNEIGGFQAKGKEILTPKEVQQLNDIDILKQSYIYLLNGFN
jgi:hypothetical protein